MHCEWSTACHNVQSCQTCKRNLVLEGLLPAESKLQVKKDLDSMQGIYGRPYVADLDACSYCVQEPSQDPLICIFLSPQPLVQCASLESKKSHQWSLIRGHLQRSWCLVMSIGNVPYRQRHEIPSPKLTFSHPKMDGWEMILWFWVSAANFCRANC